MASGKGKNRGVLLCILAVLLAAAIAWIATADMRAYHRGMEYLSQHNYSDAAAIFESIADYKDSAVRLLEAKYAIADGQLEAGSYLDAAEGFAALGNYLDSTEKMKKSYYRLGTSERISENYEAASEYYTLAQDYQDAATQSQRMIYTLGHNAFLAEDYESAENWFSQLEGEPEDYGNPHFMTLAESAPYLRQQLDEMAHQISFHLAQEPAQEEWAALHNYIPYHAGSAAYYDADQMVTITITEYYPADQILDAWEKNDTSTLSEDEQQVLTLALELVEQARAETENDYELEFWLHDWLCQQVVYESPNMEVGVRDYVQLRQLSCVGAMLDGAANCQGYTDAFCLLGNLAGLEVTRLFGDAGGPHTWNMIRLEEQWYILDVTFDDLSDEEYDGWTYTYCNTALDPELHIINGGTAVLDNIAEDTDIEKTWFGQNKVCFENLSAAVEYLVSQRGDQNGNWCYAMLETTDCSYEDLNKAIRKELRRQNVSYAGWLSILETSHDSSCISICWDKN